MDFEREQVQILFSECGPAVDVLQASQDRNHRVSAVESELSLIDRAAIELLLIGARFCIHSLLEDDRLLGANYSVYYAPSKNKVPSSRIFFKKIQAS